MIMNLLFLLGCQPTELSEKESLICGNHNKEWIIDKIVKNGIELPQRMETTVIFYCDGDYDVTGYIKDHWELTDDGKTINTIVLSSITQMELSSEIIILNDDEFVFKTINESDTTINYLKNKLPTTKTKQY